jgi:Family of unknown function (DUF6478)
MRGDGLIDRLLARKLRDHWARAAEAATKMDVVALKALRSRARAVRREIDRVIHVAEHRLAVPLIGPALPRQPLGTDWSWRPDLWQGPVSVIGAVAMASKAPVSTDVTLFHDCGRAELILRQIRNRNAGDLAPFGLSLEMFGFDGTFLSLAIDLPEAAVAGIGQRHLIRIEAQIETERPVVVFARLNIRVGPNVEQILRQMPPAGPAQMAEFDLAYGRMDTKRIEKIWLDLIFEKPALNQITLRDVTVSRRPRAEI